MSWPYTNASGTELSQENHLHEKVIWISFYEVRIN